MGIQQVRYIRALVIRNADNNGARRTWAETNALGKPRKGCEKKEEKEPGFHDKQLLGVL